MIISNNALTLGLAIAVSAFVLTGSVKAHDSDAPARITVRANDLDLTHAPDAEILFARIEEASTQACGGTPDYRRAGQVAAFDHCRKAAIWQAVRQVNQPLLSEIADTEAMPMRLAVR